MRFKDPWLLLLIPGVLLIVFIAKKRRKEPSIMFPDGGLLSVFKKTLRIRLFENIIFLRALAAVFIILALARPQKVIEETIIHREGIDIALAVDVSTSMLAEDFKTAAVRKNRIEAAKNVIKEFVRARNGDRIGMVVFASRAYTACPLTLDYDWLLQGMERVEPGMIEDGTAIGSGIMSALKSLKNTSTKTKIVILLTDGRNNAGDITPLMAAEAARALNIKIYTIGAGSEGPALYPVQDVFGSKIYKTVDAEIDSETLTAIASRTGARYFRATDSKTLGEIYKEIDRLEKSRIEQKVYYEFKELFPLFLILAIALLFLELIFRNTLLRKIP